MNSKYENTDMKMQPKKQRNLTGFFNLLSIAGLAGTDGIPVALLTLKEPYVEELHLSSL